MSTENPSVLQFERGRGCDASKRKPPLRLAICVREGLVVMCQRGNSPPSCNLCEGGVGGDVSKRKPPPPRNLSEGGVGGDTSKRKLRLTFRVREGGGGAAT